MVVDLSRHHLGSCAPCPRQGPKACNSSFMDIIIVIKVIIKVIPRKMSTQTWYIISNFVDHLAENYGQLY